MCFTCAKRATSVIAGTNPSSALEPNPSPGLHAIHRDTRAGKVEQRFGLIQRCPAIRQVTYRRFDPECQDVASIPKDPPLLGI